MEQATLVDEEDAARDLEALMERARTGENIVITRSGEPYAKLTGADDPVLGLLWQLEEEFWRADSAFYRERLHPACVMVFPAPTGIMRAEATVHSLSQAPRWDAVSFSDHAVGSRSGMTHVLAYRAEAERSGARYAAYCSSVYQLVAEKWLLSLHQQTPI